jgi:hypothetical protein
MSTHRVESEVCWTLINGSHNACAGVTETAHKLLAGEGVRKYAHIQAVGCPVR